MVTKTFKTKPRFYYPDHWEYKCIPNYTLDIIVFEWFLKNAHNKYNSHETRYQKYNFNNFKYEPISKLTKW